MSKSQPNVLSIDANVSFADALAEGILNRFATTPQGLAEVTLLLPTRRACRTVRDAFLRQSEGTPLLLPRMFPLGDLDEDALSLSGWFDGEGLHDLPPAIAPERRKLLLMKAILARADTQTTADQATRLAGELASLIDRVHTEGLHFDGLKKLVPEDYAEHWQTTLDFLKIITEVWPLILKEEGCLDPAERRNHLLAAQSRLWQSHPPQKPVIAAGSTASIPAVAELLATLARLEHGMVVLPGLDRFMSEEDWAHVDACHPQFGLKELMTRLRISVDDVAPWPEAKRWEGSHRQRVQLLSQAMLPAQSSGKWRDLPTVSASVLDGIERIDCPTPLEEAGVIALLLRHELETPESRAALVTPDRNLARRVAAQLRRWGIEIDDSAGVPLKQSPAGIFMRLLARVVIEEFSPLSVLALCKHPYAALGEDPKIFRRKIRKFEVCLLRGPRPAPGLSGLKSALEIYTKALRRRTGRLTQARKQTIEELSVLIDHLELALMPFIKVMKRKECDLLKLIEAQIRAAENLATTDQAAGAETLWLGEDGEAAAEFFSNLMEGAKGLGDITPASYPGLLDAMMDGVALRPRFGAHPRLAILGLFEARLQHHDLVVLGGLNEGTWPPEVTPGSWMSRPMMDDFGLPRPEFQIGQSAHDFAQHFCAGRVVLTRSERVDGTPSVRARWLRRLENRLHDSELGLEFSRKSRWLSWHGALEQVGKTEACLAPNPKPPLSARPREMFVTDVERWMRDPYGLYAKRILGLKKLDPIDADLGAADYGNLIHEALEHFVETYPKDLPENALEKLIEMGWAVFEEVEGSPEIWMFWWPRFENVARWFIEQEIARRPLIAKSYSECTGHMILNAEAGDFKVSAKADRINLMADGSLEIIDYKTGSVPRSKEIEAGFAPQLPLEGAIAKTGGFDGLGKRDVSRLEFWKLGGADKPGEIKPASKAIDEVVETAWQGIKGLVAAYDRPETGYPARPNPEFAPTFSDFEHLARIKEWASNADEEGGEG